MSDDTDQLRTAWVKQQTPPVPPSHRRCHIYPGTMPDIIQFSEHSELCETVAIRHKCKECIKSYSCETKRLYRAKKAAEKRKTRQVANNEKSKYASVLCINCKDKAKKDVCHECRLKYQCAVDKEYRSNLTKRKLVFKESEL